MQEHYIDHNKVAHIMNTTNILRISTHTIAICMTNGRCTKTRGPKTSGAYTSTDHAKLASQLAKLFTHQLGSGLCRSIFLGLPKVSIAWIMKEMSPR